MFWLLLLWRRENVKAKKEFSLRRQKKKHWRERKNKRHLQKSTVFMTWMFYGITYANISVFHLPVNCSFSCMRGMHQWSIVFVCPDHIVQPNGRWSCCDHTMELYKVHAVLFPYFQLPNQRNTLSKQCSLSKNSHQRNLTGTRTVNFL